MTASTALAAKEAAPLPTPPQEERKDGRRRKRSSYSALRDDQSDGEAKRLAAAILEVLAGGRTPTEAAAALGISPPRYYLLEERALKGLVAACRRRPRGRVKTSEWEAEKLRGEVKRLERECGRWQALVRAAHRTVGLAAPAPSKPEPGRKWRRRSPVARALRAAKALKGEAKAKPAGEGLEKGGGTGDDAPAVVK